VPGGVAERIEEARHGKHPPTPAGRAPGDRHRQGDREQVRTHQNHAVHEGRRDRQGQQRPPARVDDALASQNGVEGREQRCAQQRTGEPRGQVRVEPGEGHQEDVEEELLVGVVIRQPAEGRPGESVEHTVLAGQLGDGEVVAGIAVVEAGGQLVERRADAKEDEEPEHVQGPTASRLRPCRVGRTRPARTRLLGRRLALCRAAMRRISSGRTFCHALTSSSPQPRGSVGARTHPSPLLVRTVRRTSLAKWAVWRAIRVDCRVCATDPATL
jgi:hypothetical protein